MMGRDTQHRPTLVLLASTLSYIARNTEIDHRQIFGAELIDVESPDDGETTAVVYVVAHLL